MAYSEGGYIPSDFEDILSRIIVRVNEEFGTDYTRQTFIGTNFYKCFYPKNGLKTRKIRLFQSLRNLKSYYSEVFWR